MEKSQKADLQSALADTQAALEDLFGTPDEPLWPKFSENEADLANLVQLERLQQASGAVRSDEADRHFGLYREHCVQCHGISGDGLGPTSRFLNPYPRDFRLGKFKFKSTPIGQRPTRADLHRVLVDGLKGTSMPSFRLLKDEELEVLVDYVIFLSVRGQVERQMITDAALELDYEAGDRLYDRANRETNPELFKAQLDRVTKIAADAAKQWLKAQEAVTVVPEPPTDFPLYVDVQSLSAPDQEKLQASIARGRKLFQGPIANCASCHGATAMGDGQTNNYDAWTKDWTEGIDLLNKDDLRPFLKLGALKPRVILPRNLRTGVYRGGSEPHELYLRIVNGIDGSPMPATAMQPSNPQGLTESDVWDLVNFLLNLPNEAISKDASIAVAQRSDN
ncbi:MAG: cytochrome c [Pirellulaceae bacterium]|nr:cytochrome c [Pirellulaceae bacterium]